MFIVRYCNNRGQIIDQIVLKEYMYAVYRDIKEKYGEADLILRLGETEYTLI